MFSYFWLCLGSQRPPIGKIAAHSAYYMFSYKYLIVNLDFPTTVSGKGIFSDCAIS